MAKKPSFSQRRSKRLSPAEKKVLDSRFQQECREYERELEQIEEARAGSIRVVNMRNEFWQNVLSRLQCDDLLSEMAAVNNKECGNG